MSSFYTMKCLKGSEEMANDVNPDQFALSGVILSDFSLFLLTFLSKYVI